MKERVYKYDNVKAFLIFLVVVGHMTTDYVSDSHLVRWITLWIYMFHMPAFIFLSGLVHKQYITEDAAAAGVRGEKRLRSDKILGFFLCGYALKVFLQFSRTLMGQNPLWHWIEEPGIPWYLFVMAEYELLFYFLRKVDGGGSLGEDKKTKAKIMIGAAFALSAIIGYFPIIGDAFCLSRMINFLPIYMLGYYMDMRKFLEFIEQKKLKNAGVVIIAISLLACYLMPWGGYSLRKWFTGRRSYEFLSDFFGSYAVVCGWGIRLLVWAVAILITLAVIAVIPNRDMGFITVVGARTLNVYFWHRPLCYLFRNWAVLPKLCILFGGTYDESVAGQIKGLAFGGSSLAMIAAFAIYLLIAAAMTAFFSLKPFGHPCNDLMILAARLTGKGRIMKRVNRIIILMIIMALALPYTASAVSIDDQEIKFDKILNARDMGGYKTKQGTRVKRGVLIRSGELSYATKSDLKKLKNEYKVKRVIDFRYKTDRKYCPDKKVSGAKNILVTAKYSRSPSKSSPKKRYRRLRAKSKNKLRSAAIPTFGKAGRSYTNSLVNSSYSKKQYKKYFEQLLANKNGDGVLIHCIYGKDRTGVAAFMTLVALGVDEETAYKEYRLTNAYLKKYGKKAYSKHNLGVRERDLRYAVKKAKKKYGSLNNFLKKAYGLDSKKLKQLREIYTE